MCQRCHNPRHKFYKDYGGRGITVHAPWRDYLTFRAEAPEKPEGSLTFDRIDNDRGYEPGNVQWVSRREQQNNRRTSLRLTACGETKTLSEWSAATGMSLRTLTYRLRAAEASSLPLDLVIKTSKYYFSRAIKESAPNLA